MLDRHNIDEGCQYFFLFFAPNLFWTERKNPPFAAKYFSLTKLFGGRDIIGLMALCFDEWNGVNFCQKNPFHSFPLNFFLSYRQKNTSPYFGVGVMQTSFNSLPKLLQEWRIIFFKFIGIKRIFTGITVPKFSIVF